MLILQDTPVGDLTRGGQIVIHFIRMFLQVLRKFSGALLLAIACGALFTFFLLTDPYERYLGWRFASSYVATEWLRNGDRVTDFKHSDGTSIDVREAALRASPALQEHADWLLHRAEMSLWIALGAVCFLFTGIVTWVWKSGHKQRRDEFVRGGEIVEELELARLAKEQGSAGALRIGNVPLEAGSETRHILCTGATGSGKSTAIYQLMEQIRRRKERFICYSPTGDFIERFYREGDIVLNPFDDRCPSWDLWNECPEDFHYEAFAQAMIPDHSNEKDPFWPQTARGVLACLGQETARRNERSFDRFLSLLLGDLESLHAYLSHTEAAAAINPNADRAALSVRMTAVTYGRALRYLPTGRSTFHIRQWVRNEKASNCIFMTALDEQQEAVRPLLTAWLELFTSAILSLPENRQRRIWLLIDELPSLQKIPSLPKFLSQGRKFGGCGVLGFQQISQMRECYGQHGAQTIVGGCSTWLCMRQNDPEMAKWTSESFGDVEIVEAQQGLSYGANDMRDGVSLTQTRKVRPLLIPSEVIHLDDLEGYIRLPGPVPAGHLRLRWEDRKKVAAPYIPSTAPRVWQPRTPTEAATAAPTVSGDMFLLDAHERPDSIRASKALAPT